MELPRKIYYKFNQPFVDFCIKTGITANQLSIINHAITLSFGCYFFIKQQYFQALAICLLNGFLDYLDGDVAKATGKFSRLGIWLDSGFDVIVQNIVMASIGLGCYYAGMNYIWLIIFMVSNASNNFIAFNYNQTFGFDSYNGNEMFRKFMDRKCHFLNIWLKNMIDPTGNFLSLFIYTYRHWIVLGVFWNMKYCFIIMTIISTIKWMVMFVIYALYLRGDRFLFVLRALSFLDEESDEFYQLQRS